MRPQPLPPLDLMKERFDYNPATGELTYKVSISNNKIKVGTPVKLPYGKYKRVTFPDGSKCYAHRVAWAIYYNEQLSPDTLIDHINGIKSDNRICNLRKVGYVENGHNRCIQKNNTSGHRGVKWDKKRNRWVAYIYIQRKKVYYGWYKELGDAVTARLKAEQDYNIFVRE